MSENGLSRSQKPTVKPRKCPSEEQKQLETLRSRVQRTISGLHGYEGTITDALANGHVSAETVLEILCKGEEICHPFSMLISVAVQKFNNLSPTGSIRSICSEQLTPELLVSPTRSRSSSTASATSTSGSRRNSRSVSSEIQSVQQLETIADTIMRAVPAQQPSPNVRDNIPTPKPRPRQRQPLSQEITLHRDNGMPPQMPIYENLATIIAAQDSRPLQASPGERERPIPKPRSQLPQRGPPHQPSALEQRLPQKTSGAPPVMDMMNGDDDVTGESGFGTGADYDSRDLWKQAMKSPPPVTEGPDLDYGPSYAVLKGEEIDEDEPYMALENYRMFRGVTADEHS